jgi:protease-4
MMLADYVGFFESQGIKIHTIYSTLSTEKNKGYRDAMKGEYDTILSEDLDPFVKMFIADVKAARPNVDESVFKGKTYYAQDALKLGLIDGIKSFDEVVARAFELGQNNGANSNTNNMFGKNKFTKLTAFAEAKPEDRTPEMLAAVHTELAENNINAKLVEESELTKNANEIERLKTENASLTTKVTNLETENTNLKGLASENNLPVKTGTDTVTTPKADYEKTSVDKLADEIRARKANKPE